jgi:CRISPR-associated protein Csb2
MFALGIRYLNGVVVACHGQREQAEWPPHPARVFMALVAAHYQTGADPGEREALLWLETLGPPEIHAPEASPCAVVTQYVPVNDDSAQCYNDPNTQKVKFYQEIPGTPLRRNRQPRTFARAALAGDTVVLHWPNAEPEPKVREALAGLCSKVSRVGHSISLVQVWLADAIPPGLERWVPDADRATNPLRVTAAGTLAMLDRDFNASAVARYAELVVAKEQAPTKKARQDTASRLKAEFPNGAPLQHRPRLSVYHGYARSEAAGPELEMPATVFSPHLLVFSLERRDAPYRYLDLACTLVLTERWREALASQANDLSPEAQALVSGHASDGTPLQTPHVAFLPLSFVGHPHADGRLSGLALALPGDMRPEIRGEILRAAARVCEQGLMLGQLGAWDVQPVTMARPLETLRASTWTAHPIGATHWGTVTPIAFDQHPKAKDQAEYVAELTGMIRAACERVGLSAPREITPTPVSAHLGAPPAHAFPRLRRKDGSERRHTHAIIIFGQRVRGPVVLGAGRYRGYGLCRPIEQA